MGALAQRRVARLGFELLWRTGVARPPSGSALATLPTGGVLRCDLADRTQRRMWQGLFETRESQEVERALRPGGVFVDVGAHIGWYSVMAAQLVGPSGRVLAFEPFPSSFLRLQHNLEINHLDNVEARQIAMSDRAGTIIAGRQTGSDSGSVTIGGRAQDACAEVESRPLDDVVPPTLLVDFVKIDVEGHEGHVIAGGQQTLARSACVLIELNESALRANGSSAEDLRLLLADLGLKRQRLVQLSPLHAVRARIKGGPRFANLVATR